jgi:branched-chain amino acid transport system ATP-binding protein
VSSVDVERSAGEPSGGAQRVVLRTTGLTWRVGGFTILEGVDLAVHEGEFLSIIGPNGAGKTSLLNCISGVNHVTAGRVELNGEDVTRMRPAYRVRRRLGRTFQTSSLFPGLTVLENARLAAQAALGGNLSVWRRPHMGDTATRKGLEALAEVGLADRGNLAVADLAHGDKRKLEIALLLCSDPQILLLDEPTAGVSAEEVLPLVAVIRDVHARGRTVVMVEHRIELVVNVSDRIAVVHHGKLLTTGSRREVMADETVRRAYLGEPL